MKKQHYYLWIIWLLAMSSCVIEHGDPSSYQYYNAGRQAFKEIEGNITAMMEQFDIALRLNAYLATPTEERETAEDRYFPECKIRPNGLSQWIGLNNGDTVFRISTGNYLLDQERSTWKYTDRNTEETNITSSGNGKWILETNRTQNSYWCSDARFEIGSSLQAYPQNFENNDFTVSGSGQCSSYWNENITMDFEITAPLHKLNGSQSFFIEGSLDIQAIDKDLELSERIEVRLSSLPDQQRSLKVYYKGETFSYTEIQRDTEGRGFCFIFREEIHQQSTDNMELNGLFD